MKNISNVTVERDFLARCVAYYEVEKEEVSYFVGKLSEDDFTSDLTLSIFKAIKKILAEGDTLSILSLWNEMEKYEKFSSWEISDAIATQYFPPLSETAKILRKRTINRKLQKLAETGNRDGVDSSEFSRELSELSSFEHEKMTTSSAEFFMKAMEGRNSPKGFSTGFHKLDENTKCLKKNHFWIIGGYSNTGKSQFAFQLIEKLLRDGAKVSLLSLEMSGEDVMERILNIKTSRGIQEHEAANEIVGKDFQILTHIHNLGEISRYIDENSFDVVFIDYLQIIQTNSKHSIYERMVEISGTLKRLCQKKDVCIVALSQVSEDYKKAKSYTTMGFKGAGELGADSDVGIILSRNFDEEAEREYANDCVPMDIILRKNRFGRTGAFQIFFNKTTGIIQNDSPVSLLNKSFRRV